MTTLAMTTIVQPAATSAVAPVTAPRPVAATQSLRAPTPEPVQRADRYVPWDPEAERGVTYDREGRLEGEARSTRKSRRGAKAAGGTAASGPGTAGEESAAARGANRATEEGGKARGPGSKGLPPEEVAKVRTLAARDREVRAHEAAHASAGGGAAGGASFTFQTGPDGKQYAVGGEVPIRLGGGSSPDQQLANAEQVRRAALAPAKPSAQDSAIAAAAAAVATAARQALAEQQRAELSGGSDAPTAAPSSGGGAAGGASPAPVAGEGEPSPQLDLAGSGGSGEAAAPLLGASGGGEDAGPALPLPGSGDAAPEPQPLPGSGRAAPLLAAAIKKEKAEEAEKDDQARGATVLNGGAVTTSLARAGRLEEEAAVAAFQKSAETKPNALGFVGGADRPASKKDLDSFEIEGRHQRSTSPIPSGGTGGSEPPPVDPPPVDPPPVDPPPVDPPPVDPLPGNGNGNGNGNGGNGNGNGNGNGGGNGNGNGNGRR